MLPACKELGIGFVPWSPLCQAYFTGTVRAGTNFPKDDMSQLLPPFEKDAMEANQPLIDALNEVCCD